ncbi:DUF4976 domain-containing protein [Nonomuraea turkmeniaca]|uniref:DUF4976 domain-containing protein n=1 Tax=Nonomuraea turkmeniaca TaxID=103838 RepID=A0A5S4FXS3_9ACTN|nr:sulfatase-like hydrolase/transferase [Nonomuraea turkmeniaca]TMR24911.1 DUF4976 domain-containing protein [Nonomuraea turkmeniaca]
MTKRPNILWLCADQQRFDTVGCYGNPFVETPNLDRLAAGGVMFDHAYAQSPVCTPSRASFLTGRYPRTTRARQNGGSIPAGERLIPRILADAGYTCGLVGKLHIRAAHPRPHRPVESRIDDGYSWFSWSHQPPPNAAQAAMDWPTNAYSNWLRARGITFERQAHPDTEHVQIGVEEQHQHTTWCAETATEFVETMAGFPQPWLLSVNFYDPHHPFDPPKELLERYLDRLDDIPLPRFRPGELDNKPLLQQEHYAGGHSAARTFVHSEMSEREHRVIRAAYWAMIDMLDRQIGRILDALERTGQREDTIVIFHADHGEMLGDHGIYLKGAYFYDPAVRVPLILNWPRRLASGRRVSGLVELVDVAPTVLEAVGADLEPGIQGRSLMPLIDGRVAEHRDDVYCEFYNAGGPHRGQGTYATMVRSERHKIVVYHGSGDGVRGELYDLDDDPGEHVNRWDDPAYLAAKTDMLQRMTDRMAMTADPLPVRDDVW